MEPDKGELTGKPGNNNHHRRKYNGQLELNNQDGTRDVRHGSDTSDERKNDNDQPRTLEGDHTRRKETPLFPTRHGIR